MSFFELLYRMVRLPWAMVAYGLEAFGRAVEDLREIADGGLDLLDEPPWWEDDQDFEGFVHFAETDFQGNSVKEANRMYVDQDLSGNMVKVVQYVIVSVATDVADNARVVTPRPRVVAFSDDMTSEDFTSWIMATFCDDIDDWEKKHMPRDPGPSDLEEGDLDPDEEHPRARHRRRKRAKYFRVAFTVMGRFAAADFDYEQMQAFQLRRIANRLDGWPPPPQIEPAGTAKPRKSKQ